MYLVSSFWLGMIIIFFARKGVIFHSGMGVLPLFGLLKGLLILISVVIIKAFSLLFTHATRACAPVCRASRCRARSLPVPDMTAPGGGTGVLCYSHRNGERKKQRKKKWIINSLTSCCSGPRRRRRAKPDLPELSSASGGDDRDQSLGFIFR